MSLDINISQATQAFSQSGFNAAAKVAHTGDDKRFEAAAREFEAMFVAEMMKPMFEGIEVDSMFGGGKGEEIFRGLLLQEYGKMMAETGSLGIADAVKAEMIEIQARTDGTAKMNKQETHDDAAI